MKRINRFSSRFIKGHIFAASFIIFVIVGLATMLFLAGKPKIVDATGCYPTNGIGFFDCSDVASSGSDVLNNTSSTPDTCSLPSYSTICPSGSGFTTNATTFEGQLTTDANYFCNNIASYSSMTSAQKQNGIGALYIILTMLNDSAPSGNAYCPSNFNSGSNNIVSQWETLVTDANTKTGGVSVNWDYCPGQTNSGVGTDDCGYTYTENTFDAAGSSSGKNDIYRYSGTNSGAGPTPAIAFYNDNNESGTPSYLIKYEGGSPVGNITVSSSPVSIYGLVYYNIPGGQNYNPLGNIQINKSSSCTSGENLPAIYSGASYRSPISPIPSASSLVNYSFTADKQDSFCLAPQTTPYYPNQNNGGQYIYANTTIQPDFATNNGSGSNCSGNPSNEYVNQVVGSPSSDSASSACNYGMGYNNEYDIEYTQYYISITGTCSGGVPTISGKSDFTSSLGETASLGIYGDGVGSSSSPAALTVQSNYTYSATNPAYAFTAISSGKSAEFYVVGQIGGQSLTKDIVVDCSPTGTPDEPPLYVTGADVEAGIDYSSTDPGCTMNTNAIISGDGNWGSGNSFSAITSGPSYDYQSGWLNTSTLPFDAYTYAYKSGSKAYYGTFLGNTFNTSPGAGEWGDLDDQDGAATNYGSYPMCVPDYYGNASLLTNQQAANETDTTPLGSQAGATAVPFEYCGGSCSTYPYYTFNYTADSFGPTTCSSLCFAVWNYDPPSSADPLYIPPMLVNNGVPAGTHTIILDNSGASIYIGGNIEYNDSTGYTSLAEIPSFEVIIGPNSGGNIYVDSGADSIEGVYVAEGKGDTFYSCATNFFSSGTQYSGNIYTSLFNNGPTNNNGLIKSCDNSGKYLEVWGSVSAYDVDLNRTYPGVGEWFWFNPEDWLPYTQVPSSGNGLSLADYTKLPPKL